MRKHRTRNLEIPRCAIAHLRSGACAPPRNDGVTLRLHYLRHPRFPGVGCFPHHALAALAAEQFDRIVIVDVAELSLVDAVAAQLLQPPWKSPGGVLGNAELQVFLL